jgi:hypothetical protein
LAYVAPVIKAPIETRIADPTFSADPDHFYQFDIDPDVEDRLQFTTSA